MQPCLSTRTKSVQKPLATLQFFHHFRPLLTQWLPTSAKALTLGAYCYSAWTWFRARGFEPRLAPLRPCFRRGCFLRLTSFVGSTKPYVRSSDRDSPSCSGTQLLFLLPGSWSSLPWTSVLPKPFPLKDFAVQKVVLRLRSRRYQSR